MGRKREGEGEREIGIWVFFFLFRHLRTDFLQTGYDDGHVWVLQFTNSLNDAHLLCMHAGM